MKMLSINTHMNYTPSRFCRLIPLVIGVFLFLNLSLKAQNGEALFRKNCSACHSVGDGRLVGPDLKGVTTKRSESWIIKFVTSSQSLIKSGDADAVAIFEEFNKIQMPDQALSEPEIKDVMAYIASKGSVDATASGSDTAALKSAQPAGKSTDLATAEDISLGQRIFDGSQSLTNGGASCISCHNVASDRVMPGGMLAKDLTTVHTRMGGDVGLAGILNAPPFPAMTQSYQNNPLTEDEIYALSAFLNKVDKESSSVEFKASLNPLLKWGSIGLVCWIAFIFIVWANRKKDTVKLKIFERQVKSK